MQSEKTMSDLIHGFETGISSIQNALELPLVWSHGREERTLMIIWGKCPDNMRIK